MQGSGDTRNSAVEGLRPWREAHFCEQAHERRENALQQHALDRLVAGGHGFPRCPGRRRRLCRIALCLRLHTSRCVGRQWVKVGHVEVIRALRVADWRRRAGQAGGLLHHALLHAVRFALRHHGRGEAAAGAGKVESIQHGAHRLDRVALHDGRVPRGRLGVARALAHLRQHRLRCSNTFRLYRRSIPTLQKTAVELVSRRDFCRRPDARRLVRDMDILALLK